MLCGVKDYRKLILREEQAGGDETGADGEVLLGGGIVVVVIVPIPQAGAVLDALPGYEFYTIAALSLVTRQHDVVELRQ